MAKQITDATFDQEVLQSSDVVLVDFWAPWCGPCRVMEPAIEELAAEFEGKGAKIVKLNVDENPESQTKYSVMSIPTLIF
jgi:thioredoxin 1